jgi:glycosyltransferase involved in cell wall biosynthesis
MRIIYHHRTQLDDAQGIHVRAIVRAFRELGHEVEVISLVASPSKRAWRIDTGRLPRALYEVLSLGYNLYGYRRLARAIREGKPDLIYERYAPYAFCGVLAARRFGVPLLLEINAPWHDHSPSGEAPRFGRLARRLERWICANSTRTIAVTAVLKRFLVEEGVPERQVAVMHNAADPLVFHPEVSAAEVRRRHRLNGSLVAGFVGWLRPWHGLEGLIDAVHTAGLLQRGLRLLIVGEGPAFPKLEARVRQLGLGGQVVLTGPVAHADVPVHVAALDIALQPSAPAHACPMKLVEYMAMGRCILAPGQPNIRELLSDGVTARLFAPGDHAALARSLSELMASPALRATLGRNAHRTIVERNLTWRMNAARAIDLVWEGQNARAGLSIAEVESKNVWRGEPDSFLPPMSGRRLRASRTRRPAGPI